MSERKYKSFAEFWPYYVSEHGKPVTRLLHLIGTTAGLALLVFFIASGRWWLFPLALVPGYGAAWAGHFFVEKNKPATFQYPLWSFMGDYKMIGLMLSGKMNAEVKRVASSGKKPA
ncbi:MAG: Mpo1-like protein [Pyrinomonadaceae bacterium]